MTQGSMLFFVICSQTLSKSKVEPFYAGQNKITNMTKLFFGGYTFSKKNPKWYYKYSFDGLVFGWNDTIGLLDIAHKCKK